MRYLTENTRTFKILPISGPHARVSMTRGKIEGWDGRFLLAKLLSFSIQKSILHLISTLRKVALKICKFTFTASQWRTEPRNQGRVPRGVMGVKSASLQFCPLRYAKRPKSLQNAG